MDALIAVVRGLPADLPAVVLVVLHISPTGPSLLPQILDRASPMPVVVARDGAPLAPGTIHVAPPDRHLVVRDRTMAVTDDSAVGTHRPSIDALFCSAAETHGARVTGVVLSGMRDDGSVGLARIKELGGTAVVQDPADAEHDAMPRNAIGRVAVDAILPVAAIGSELTARLRASSGA